MLIEAPKMEQLNGYNTGKIKFFNNIKNFGFIKFEDIELFFHGNWLAEPFVFNEGSSFRIGFRETFEQFVPEQIVLFRCEDNKGKLEAHDVVDSLKLSFVLRELDANYKQALLLHDTLSNYSVSIIRDIVVPKANNDTKDFDWIKIDEKIVPIFEGNDLHILKDILDKEHIRTALNQPHTKLLFQIYYNEEWVECDNPLLRIA